MTNIQKVIFTITTFLNGAVLVRFSLSKLFAWPISVKAFVEMAKPLGIDPTFFRLSTGVLITTICLGYFLSFYLLITKKYKENIKTIFGANLLGTGVMIGALISEYGLRVTPKMPLVFIATFIVITSVFQMISILPQLKKELSNA